MINVMIVDDHDLVRTGIKRMLDDIQGIKVIGEAANAEDAIKLARQLIPDVVLMDLKMPGIGGLEATHKLLRFLPDTKVLAVTAYAGDLLSERLLQAGAAGYITKESSMNEMVKAIRSIYSGQRYISPVIASKLALKHVTEQGKTPFDTLSERELQITLMIIQGSSVRDIAESLHVSPKTVNSYRYRIFDKLTVKNDVELTLLAISYHLLDIEEGTT